MPDKKEVLKETVETKKEETTKVEESKELGAQKIVRNYSLWSAGAGLIPIPLVGMGAVGASQLKMLHSLSKHYDIEFKENIAKSIIATLVATLGASSIKYGVITNFIKSIPLVGIVGSYSFALYSSALSYALGKVFVKHFESGGTFLDFDLDKMKNQFKKFYEDGKNAVAKLKPKKKEVKAEATA